jgi:hypothetical protein
MFGSTQSISEGKSTRMLERVTARAPSSLWLWLAGGAIAASLGLFIAGRKESAIFVGLWPLALLTVGSYNKIVKTLGSD